MDLIRTESVVKQQGPQFRLGPVDLSLRSGEILGIVGNRGSGKTTLLKLLWGFLMPDQGVISVFQLRPHLHQMSIRRHTGYVPELPYFEGETTVRHHLQFMSHFYDGWSETTADSLLEVFGIDPGVFVHDLSSSARVKLSLISASAHNPSLLLLDNPMARLDPRDRIEILSFLKALARKRGIGVVVSTQCAGDLCNVADSTLMLTGGTIDV